MRSFIFLPSFHATKLYHWKSNKPRRGHQCWCLSRMISIELSDCGAVEPNFNKLAWSYYFFELVKSLKRKVVDLDHEWLRTQVHMKGIIGHLISPAPLSIVLPMAVTCSCNRLQVLIAVIVALA